MGDGPWKNPLIVGEDPHEEVEPGIFYLMGALGLGGGLHCLLASSFSMLKILKFIYILL